MSDAVFHTSEGVIRVELLDAQAPETVANFARLAGDGYYDGLTFHRVIEDFMIQGGCPRGDGTGGPGYQFDDEASALELPVDRGALAMANAGPNTNGSQFFIVTAQACEWLNGKHAVFGRVVEGMEIADGISRVATDGRDRPLTPVTIDRLEILQAP
jgi:cyclophilin family peptidyl-prolyl cis-trans isomerase